MGEGKLEEPRLRGIVLLSNTTRPAPFIDHGSLFNLVLRSSWGGALSVLGCLPFALGVRTAPCRVHGGRRRKQSHAAPSPHIKKVKLKSCIPWDYGSAARDPMPFSCPHTLDRFRQNPVPHPPFLLFGAVFKCFHYKGLPS